MNRRSTCLAGLALAALLTFPLAAENTRRPLKVDDIFVHQGGRRPPDQPGRRAGSPTPSARSIPRRTSSDTDIYMVPFAGGAARAADLQPEGGEPVRA